MVYNTVDGGVGEPYHKPASVPHGDPLSMMVTALLMRPWLLEMRTMAMKPRILADELQIVSIGPRHLENFVNASDRTHAHLEADGGENRRPKNLDFLIR